MFFLICSVQYACPAFEGQTMCSHIYDVFHHELGTGILTLPDINAVGILDGSVYWTMKLSEQINQSPTWYNYFYLHHVRDKCPFFWHEWTSIHAWIRNYIHYIMCDEITYPFPNGAAVKWPRNKAPNDLCSLYWLSKLWMPHDAFEDKSALIQASGWWRHSANHYPSAY